jgi:tetratricopeptide (TPR) repeat protein
MAPVTRRRRLLLNTGAAAAVFVAVTAVVVTWLTSSGEVYRPGEDIAGLTAELIRDLPDDYPRVTFTDVTAEAGILFHHFSGQRSSQLPEDLGSGAAWGDFDNDGWQDLYVVNAAGPLTMTDAEVTSTPAHAKLYRNNGDGTFTDVAERAGVDFRGWGMGAEWADVDNDGFLDLFVSTYGTNVFYRNEGDGTFTDRTDVAGLRAPPGFWAGIGWGDYDRDGHVDLYVTGYVQYSSAAGDAVSQHYDVEEPASINPSSFPPERNLLYHNRGDGTFEEVATRTGVINAEGRGLEASWTDFDRDGWPDLYVANDVSDNVLFRNLGNGVFSDVSHAARVADYRGAMGIAVGDWDGDADMDMLVTHWIAQENALYSNKLTELAAKGGAASLQFMDEADRYGLGQIALDFVGWGTSFIDYDNDGRLDLFVVNGSTFQQRDDPTQLRPMRDQIFWNRGTKDGFYDVSSAAGNHFQNEFVGRGAAFADWDNDGDIDAYVANNGGPGILLRNDGGNANAWLKIRLEGRSSNRSAIGAKLRIVVEGQQQIREVGAQSSYLSQNALVQHFGLGGHARVDTLQIEWPNGDQQTLTAIAVNQVITIVEGLRPRIAVDDRERIRAFWVEYRKATQRRIRGDIEAAAVAYHAALALDPTHEDALYYFGNVQLELGAFDEAEASWTQLVEFDPNSSRAHAQLGRVLSCADRPAVDLRAAEAAYRKALTINQEETGPLLRLAQVALARGDHIRAQRLFDDVLRTNETSVATLYYLGYIAWRGGNSSRATVMFTAAIDAATPDEPPAGVLSEGDTKEGTTPLLADRTFCRGPERQYDGFEDANLADLTTRYHATQVWFEKLGSLDRPEESPSRP